MDHVRIMAEKGFDAEISSYIYSNEYIEVFGFDKVPFLRNKETYFGAKTIDYTRSNVINPGVAGYDGGSTSRLLSSLATGSSPLIKQRKSVGIGSTFSIEWKSRKQIGGNRRVSQRSTVVQTSLSSTIKSIHRQGGKIVSITTNS